MQLLTVIGLPADSLTTCLESDDMLSVSCIDCYSVSIFDRQYQQSFCTSQRNISRQKQLTDFLLLLCPARASVRVCAQI